MVQLRYKAHSHLERIGHHVDGVARIAPLLGRNRKKNTYKKKKEEVEAFNDPCCFLRAVSRSWQNRSTADRGRDANARGGGLLHTSLYILQVTEPRGCLPMLHEIALEPKNGRDDRNNSK